MRSAAAGKRARFRRPALCMVEDDFDVDLADCALIAVVDVDEFWRGLLIHAVALIPSAAEAQPKDGCPHIPPLSADGPRLGFGRDLLRRDHLG